MHVDAPRANPESRGVARRMVTVVASIIGFLLLCLIAWIVFSIWQLNTGPHTEGDPGGRRFGELSSDSIFVALPTGVADVKITHTPVKYQDNGAFEGSGWNGAAVEITFKSSLQPTDVYQFYARRAAAAGWQPTGTDIVFGTSSATDRWEKIYPDGAKARLFFDLLPGDRSVIPPEHSYDLLGGIDPASWK